MRATFALLTDIPTFNKVSKLAWQLHCQYHIDIGVRRLPPHVSLKQPFEIDDLDALEAFLTEFAQGLLPSPLELTGLTLYEQPPEQPEYSVLSFSVKETEHLRATHTRLNQELAARFTTTTADFDGDTYRFHLTVAAGTGQVTPYRDAFAQVLSLPHTFEAVHLALFVYNHDGTDWHYLPYKIVPLGNPI